MIVNVLLWIATIAMIISLIFGTVESTVLTTLALLITMAVFIIYQNNYSKTKKQKPKKIKVNCIHTSLDCEGCLSQSGCLSQNENVFSPSEVNDS